MASLTTHRRIDFRKTRAAWTQPDTAFGQMPTRNTQESTDGSPIESVACSIYSTGVSPKNVVLDNSRRGFGHLTQTDVHPSSTVHCDSRTKYQGASWLVHTRTSSNRSQLQSGCASLSGLLEGDERGRPQREAGLECGRSVARQHPLTMIEPYGPTPSVPCDDVFTYASADHKFSPLDSFQDTCSPAIRADFRLQIEQFVRPSPIVGRAGPPPPPLPD